jgi:hypothetical protein
MYLRRRVQLITKPAERNPTASCHLGHNERSHLLIEINRPDRSRFRLVRFKEISKRLTRTSLLSIFPRF